MKVRFWVHINDGGDGSAYLKFFNTKEDAKVSADREFEEFGQALCDNVLQIQLEVDEHGKLLDPDSYCVCCKQPMDR